MKFIIYNLKYLKNRHIHILKRIVLKLYYMLEIKRV